MKKFFLVLFLVSVLFVLVGCFVSYEDTNGAEDYTLQSLTEADIINGGTYSKTMSSTVTVNDKTRKAEFTAFSLFFTMKNWI